MNTNEYNQPTDSKGHVLKTTELIAEELKQLDRAIYSEEPYGTIQVPLKELATYVMEYSHKDWSKSVKHGIQLGRNDCIAMLKSLLKPSTIDVRASDIKAVITALQEGQA